MMTDSPYQELTQFHLAQAAQRQHDSDVERIRALHPDLSPDQIQGVLDGSIRVAGDWQNDEPPQALNPSRPWRIQTPPASKASAQVIDPALKDAFERRQNFEKELAKTTDDAQKQQIQASLDALLPEIQRLQTPEPSPEELLPSAPSGFGSRYKIGGHVYQSFSPTKLPGGSRIQIGNNVQEGAPEAPAGNVHIPNLISPDAQDAMSAWANRIGAPLWSIPTRTDLAAPATFGAEAQLPDFGPTGISTIIVRTKKDFDALPSGTIYSGANGKRFRKP